MIEVEVLYVGNARVCVPYEEKETLSLAAVLALVVRDTEIDGKKQNIAEIHGFDNYALCERRLNGGLWIALYGWDDDDFIWRRAVKHLDPQARFQVDPPLGCMHMVFRGQSIPADDWQEALRILDKEML